jgi:hypothetical protein
LALDAVAARSRLVAEPQPRRVVAELSAEGDSVVDRTLRAADRPDDRVRGAVRRDGLL